jgi:ankyrin repeat protein
MHEKNPRNEDGITLLHNAAVEGHLKICKLIVLEVTPHTCDDDENAIAWTPRHVAAKYGYSEIYNFIAERVEEKNPLDNEGRTPLHKAIDKGHLHICRILLDILGIENPISTDPEQKRPRKE